MSLLKWALIGGAGYLGYKMLTQPAATTPATATTPSALADPAVWNAKIQGLLTEMRGKLDPTFTWSVTTFKSSGVVRVVASRNSTVSIDKTFKSIDEALAWVNVGQATGQQAVVNWQGYA